MECGHSSIREYTKARGRGHAPNLAEVSAKSVCKFVSRHHFMAKAKDSKTADQAEEQQQQSKDGVGKKKKLGGGGPWKAFLSEKCKGRFKLGRQVIRELREEYVKLSSNEFRYYQELGANLVAQTRYKSLVGLGGFRQQQQASSEHEQDMSLVEVGGATTKDVLAVSKPGFYVDGDSFNARFRAFSQIVQREQRQRLQDAKKVFSLDNGDPTVDGSSDPSMRELSCVRHGGSGFLQGLRKSPQGFSMCVDHFEWRMPITQFVQCCLHEKGILDDNLRLQDMETQWMKDHELIQHEHLEQLQMGPGKPFPASACHKLGTCVCGERGKEAVAMTHKLKTYMKSCYGGGTQKQPSEERVRFSEGLIVVELASEELSSLYVSSSGSESGPEVLYLHAGYNNFSIWETTCARLHCSFFNPFTGCLGCFFGIV